MPNRRPMRRGKQGSAAQARAPLARVLAQLPERLRAAMGPRLEAAVRLADIDARKRVWRMPGPRVVIEGSLQAAGNVLVQSGRELGILVVTGDICCQNLGVARNHTLVCGGSLRVRDAVVATAGDSATYVAGEVATTFLASGSGAWLTLLGTHADLRVKHLTGYVVCGEKTTRTRARPDLAALLRSNVIESEEWESLSSEERRSRDRGDFIRMDTQAVLGALEQGRGILR